MSISGQTRLLGLIGWPVSHSFSPAMHNAAAGALQLDVVYVPLAVMPQQVEAALRGLVALGFIGVNVTVPHKQAVMRYLDSLDPAAQAIGAVNTIKVVQPTNPQSPISNPQSPVSKLHGFNTDWSGFLADLQANDIVVPDRDCVVLGAGGSARAVAYALAQSGGNVTVFARRPEQAQALVADLQNHLQGASLSAEAWAQLAERQSFSGPLIVNTTPLGMHPDEARSPWPEGLLFPDNAVVYDLIYNPVETRIMRRARAAGCRAHNGLGMLLQQGAQALEIWLGVKPPLDVMAESLRKEGIG